jgi:hypothetical protein
MGAVFEWDFDVAIFVHIDFSLTFFLFRGKGK